MKKKLIGLTVIMVLLGMIGIAQATLTVIGTATYNSTNYNLIWDDDNNGNSIVWLDYTNSIGTWQNQIDWASGLGSQLTVTLNPGYSTDIDWSTGWRLPDTVDGPFSYGFEGDPNEDGMYGYTAGYNLANSEMGHLFYTELGNIGSINPDGSANTNPGAPDYFLQNTGDFGHLNPVLYWSDTTYVSFPTFYAWRFQMNIGYQDNGDMTWPGGYGLAVHSGQVIFNGAIPTLNEWGMIVLSLFLLGLGYIAIRRQNN